MPTFTHDHINFHYLDKGKGLPVLFLHGMGGELGQALELLGKTKGIRLISFDYRGHKATVCDNTARNFSMQQYAEDALALLDYLEVEKCVVVGLSLGAAITLKLNFLAPERILRFVLLRPAWLNQVLPDNLKESPYISKLIEEHGAEKAQAIFQQHPKYIELEAENKNCALSALWYFQRPQAASSFLILRQFPEETPFQNFEDLKQLTQESLVLACHKDPIHPFEYGITLAEHLPNATFQEVAPRYFEEERYLQESRIAIEGFIKK
ncbi:MAG: alpha/beta hydrolase [Bacteroidota bacterium]